ncbi:hypothetical protein [Photobacterium damselae]|uniref:hypothetical protein n=1 Tax=Photobacterium damselae TaxID=38293 RepID=UPI0040692F83
MNELDIGVMPSKTMLIIWLKQLVASGLATFEDQSQKIITLAASTSNCFAIGFYTHNLHPVIAVPQKMTPWFQTIDIFKIYTVTNNHCIYIAFGTDCAEFYIKIKATQDRIKVLSPKNEDTTDFTRTVDIAAYRIQENGEFQLSRALNRVEIIEISSIDLLIPKPPAEKKYFYGRDQDDETGWLENSPFIDPVEKLPDNWEKNRDRLFSDNWIDYYLGRRNETDR